MTSALNRAIQPPINSFDSIKLPSPDKLILSNGIPVYILNIGKEDVVRMEISVRAGSAYQEKPLIASATAKLLEEGTKSYGQQQISETFDFYGASFEKEIEKDLVNFKVYSLTKHLNKLFPLLHELFFEPSFLEEEFIKYINQSKQKFQVLNSKAKYIARKKFAPLLFGDAHPYGFNAEIEDFDKIKVEDIKHFHREHYIQNNMAIFLAGKINDECIADLDKYFGLRESNLFDVRDIKSFKIGTTNEQKHFVLRENSIQNAFRIGKPMFNLQHKDFIPLKVLNTIFGGYFGSRLMSNIREDKGYTYGIGSAMVPLHHSGYFFIASEVGTEVCKKALQEVYFEIDRLKQEKVPEGELELVKNYMLGSYLRSIDGPFSMIDRVKTIFEYELQEDYFDTYTSEIDAVTSEQLQSLAQKYFSIEDMIELVVGQ